MSIAALVLIRLIANPLSNVYQKKLTQQRADPLVLMTAAYCAMAAVSLPVLLHARFTPALLRSAALLASVDVLGNVLLVAALERTDLSILGPINAYKAVVSLVLGVVLIHEIPSPAAVCGVLLVVGGSLLLSNPKSGMIWRDTGVQLRLLSLLLLSLAAVFLKECIVLSTPATAFAVWAAGATPVALLALLVRKPRRGQFRILRNNGISLLWMTATFGAAQVCTVLTFQALQVAVSLALFQTSTLLSVFFGHHFFQEPNMGRRLAASAVMIAGAILVAI